MKVGIKRVYEEPSATDGYRILVDRLWPRGLTKEKAAVDEWAKEIAPSDELRKWFHHEEGSWTEFKKRYMAELKSNDALDGFIENCRKHKNITFLYATKSNELTHAKILKELIER